MINSADSLFDPPAPRPPYILPSSQNIFLELSDPLSSGITECRDGDVSTDHI